MPNIPPTRDLVLIGGGHTHALVLRQWGMTPLPGVRLTLINPEPTASYSGMLPGFVAGHYTRENLEIDLLRLARFADASTVLSRATGIDRAAKTIHFADHPPLHFDVASVDIGITSAMPDLRGFAQHAIPAKPLDAFARHWGSFRDEALDGGAPARVVIIGGGVAGAELALAMSHALKNIENHTVTLIDRSEILGELRGTIRHKLTRALVQSGVRLRPQTLVERISDRSVHLDDGSALPSTFTLGAAGARAYDWLTETGLSLTNGYIDVDETLRSTDPTIFAVGDCAHLTHAPRPKAGVFAVREAPILFDNLRATIIDSSENSKHLRSYHPQTDYLKLISLGRKSAIAGKYGVGFQGRLMWRWKDRIDRRFMTSLKTSAKSSP